jgi:hypothetical protein
MAANTLPSGINDLFLLAERMQAGFEKHGPWINLECGTAALNEAIADLRQTEAAYMIARTR